MKWIFFFFQNHWFLLKMKSALEKKWKNTKTIKKRRYDEGWLKLEAIFALGWFQPSRRAKLVIISSQEWEKYKSDERPKKKKKKRLSTISKGWGLMGVSIEGIIRGPSPGLLSSQKKTKKTGNLTRRWVVKAEERRSITRSS